MSSETQPPTLPDHQSLVAALRRVLRSGMPITPANAEPVLTELRGVRARAVHPDLREARVDALDRLLRKLVIERLPGTPTHREAAQLLLGMSSTVGQRLTHRRLAAAGALGYDPDHFRRTIEPTILRDLAWLLQRDALYYAPRERAEPPAEPSGDTPRIDMEDIADDERADHQVLLSRIWSDVYGLRAELIERERWRDVKGEETRFQDAAGGALWYLARLLTHLDCYIEHYGRSILHGDAEYDAEALICLAGWTGELTDAQARELRLRLKRVGAWERAAFL